MPVNWTRIFIFIGSSTLLGFNIQPMEEEPSILLRFEMLYMLCGQSIPDSCNAPSSLQAQFLWLLGVRVNNPGHSASVVPMMMLAFFFVCVCLTSPSFFFLRFLPLPGGFVHVHAAILVPGEHRRMALLRRSVLAGDNLR